MDLTYSRQDFPLLQNQPELVYLDSAATTQKPASVIDAMSLFYKEQYGTVHRGVYDLSLHASAAYSSVREKVRAHLGASSSQEIVFTRGTTAGINLIAQSLSRSFLNKGDTILLSEVEHHSNLVPWQIAAKERGLNLGFIPVSKEGVLDMAAFKNLLGSHVKLISLPHIFNVLGTINPIAEIVELAHKAGALLVVDGAQGAPHIPVNVRELGADFYLFSGHKMYGPTGVGILYGKGELLEKMPPIEGGGDMIECVSLKETTYAKPPLKFEAGTPMIAEVIGLGAALDYVNNIGMDKIADYERKLTEEALLRFAEVPKVRILGNPAGSLISFTIQDTHPLDVATLLNCKKIAIRSGHLCSQPTMDRFGISACARISFGLYNNSSDISKFFDALSSIFNFL